MGKLCAFVFGIFLAVAGPAQSAPIHVHLGLGKTALQIGYTANCAPEPTVWCADGQSFQFTIDPRARKITFEADLHSELHSPCTDEDECTIVNEYFGHVGWLALNTSFGSPWEGSVHRVHLGPYRFEDYRDEADFTGWLYIQSFFSEAPGEMTVTGTLTFTLLATPLPAPALLLVSGLGVIGAVGAIGRRRARRTA